MIKIIVDGFGGDLSPQVNVEGSIKALNEIKDLEIILAGDEEILKAELSKYSYDQNRISILHAPDIITCHDKPTEAVKKKKESSMVKSIEMLRTDESLNAFVTTGSTGALLASAVLRLGRIPGVKRPAFCPILPTMNRGIVAICDSGANSDCDPFYLQQFAIMGNLYLQKTYGLEKPKVALLNVGTEEEKGDMLRKEAYQLIKETPNLTFVGNMESRDLLSGNYDLVVCDGFSGNVLLKATEGTAIEILQLLKRTLKKNLKTKLGALVIKKDVYEIKDFMDYNNYGGAVLLGCKKTVVKGHGSSKTNAIYNCVKQAYNMEKNNLTVSIAEAIAEINNKENGEN